MFLNNFIFHVPLLGFGIEKKPANTLKTLIIFKQKEIVQSSHDKEHQIQQKIKVRFVFRKTTS